MVRKTLKVILYIICSVIILLIGIIVYLNTPSGQNFVRGKAVSYLSKKLKTEVAIGHLGYGLPKFIVLNDVLLLDQAKDTLLAVGELKIDLNMLKLIHKEVDVQQLLLTGVHSHIYRNEPDTNFNFTYIITAFVGNKPADTTKAKKKSSSPDIDLDRVRFDDIHIRFDDHTGGMRLVLNLDHLNLRMKKLDLDKMLFHIKELSVSGLQSTFAQDTSYLPPKPADTAKTSLQLIADNVDLKNISFGYDDNINKLLFALNLGSLQLQLNKFSLIDNLLDIKKLAVNNTGMALTMGKLSRPPAVVDTVIKKDTTEGWNVKATDIGIAGLNFRMDNENSPRQLSGVDYSHLNLQNLVLNLHNLRYTSDSISGNVQRLAVKEQSGLEVNELRAVFNYNQQGATLNNLYLQTPYTIIQNYLAVSYPSLSELQKQLGVLQFKINVMNSVIGIRDVLLFTPAADQKELIKYKNDELKLEAIASGYLDNIDIKHFYAAGLTNTQILLDGTIKGLPEPKDLKYDLHIANFQTCARDVAPFVPDSTLKQIRLPDRFGVVGHISGTEKDYNMDMVLASSDGVAYAKGMLSMSGGNGKETYDMAIRTNKLNIGRILRKDSLLGAVTSAIHAKGRGFDIKTMNAEIDGVIPAAFVKGYHYHDISLSATVASQQGDLIFKSVDTNLQVHLTGHLDFSGKYMAARADIALDSIDFQALKLYSSDFRAHGIIHLDFPELNPDYPRGEFTWWKPIISANNVRYYLDSMYVISRPSADTGQNIIANLDVLQATITGKTPLSKIGAIIEDHINRHYTFQSSDSTKGADTGSVTKATNKVAHMVAKLGHKSANDTTTLPQSYSLNINGHIIDKPMLHGLLPGLTSFDSIHVDGSLSPRTLTLNLLAPEIVYGPTTVENASVAVRGTDSALTYKITADQISQGQVELWYANIHGGINQSTITANVSLADAAGKERFALAANLMSHGDSQIVQLMPNLKLNYKVWTVAQPNRIVSAKDGIYVQNFQISDSGQFIKASSDAPRGNSPLKIDFNNFRLANITDVLSKQDTLLADGTLSGNVTIEQMSPTLKITSNLQIQNLQVLRDTLGNLQAKVSNKDANSLDTKISLKGQGNDVDLTGVYYLQASNGNSFNMALSVNALSLHSFEGLAQNQIRNSGGYIRGKLQVQGTPSAPLITGELRTDNLVTTVSQLNSTFKMPAEKIEFTNGQVSFNNFTIGDSANNKAIISGSINIADLTNMQMDMKLNATDWRALHSTAKDNKNFYGTLLLTTDLTMKGPVTTPSIHGDLKILKGTDVTVVNTASDPQLQSSVGIVKFINMRDTGKLNVLVPKKKDTAAKRHKMAAGSDMNVNINVNKEAQFTLVIDQQSGDFINVKGAADINASVNPGGVLTLSGDYELTNGTYQMDYDFIKRKFLIQKGSMITFAGDPIQGTTLDVTAIYQASAPPYDLLDEQPDDPNSTYFKQNLPFQVALYMKGKVLQPALTFDVALPDNQVYPLPPDDIERIQGKLAQVRSDTSQLNKQVFALLILGRFVADNPFSSGAGGSAELTAMQSVSSFIGSELNQAAGKYIKGVDFSADLATTEDYTSGSAQQRTDLNLSASKRLLNDRLKLTIGNDFELQGPQTNSNESSFVPSNLAADYLLTANGRYTFRAYRRAYDEGVLEGYVTETGTDFIVNFNYNHLSDIFRKSKREPKNDTASMKSSIKN